MADTDSLLQKVRDLRALGEDATERGSQHEAEAAFARANELIQRYRLSEAELEDKTEAIIEDTADTTATPKLWRQILAFDIAKHYGCTAYNLHGERNKRSFSDIRMVGRKTDIAFAKTMYAWIRLEIASLGDRHSPIPSVQEAFRLGAVEGLRQTLEASRDAAQKAHFADAGEDVHVSAVMVLQRRDREAEDFLKKAYEVLAEKIGKEKELKPTPTVMVADVTAFEAGREKGAKIQIDRGKTLEIGGKKC